MPQAHAANTVCIDGPCLVSAAPRAVLYNIASNLWRWPGTGVKQPKAEIHVFAVAGIVFHQLCLSTCEKAYGWSVLHSLLHWLCPCSYGKECGVPHRVTVSHSGARSFSAFQPRESVLM